MKKILGLDLGTNSIGWAVVNEAENANEKSSIVKLGVRVNPLTVDELTNFEKGKSITTNADRTLKRSMRRNLQRYKLRRENLIEILKEHSFINDDAILSENGNRTTFETYRLRAKAATDEISLQEFARVLLMINKKRGYKSSRKAKSTEEGQLIDGMEIARQLYDNNLTPGQFSLNLLKQGKKYLPDFYRSDLQAEFDKVWNFQKQYYHDILTDTLKDDLRGKNKTQSWAICAKPFNIVGFKRTGKAAEQKVENYQWRVNALSEKLGLEELAVVLSEINGQSNSASGYLGDISDRSKALYFNHQTVGQYQMSELAKNPNHRLKNEVFYRQDYLNEFETIWETQAKYHKELTPELKKEIRDVVIFYQRPLKSQKGLISFCEFESKQIELEIDGKKVKKITGSRVCPKSSPLFQEFKIWQRLNDIIIYPANEKSRKKRPNARFLSTDEKWALYAELNHKEDLKKSNVLNILDLPDYEMNFDKISGNTTQSELFKAYKSIIELSGHEAEKVNDMDDIAKIFEHLGIKTDFLKLNNDIDWNNFEEQPLFKLWHLLYSFEGDKSNTGNANLIKKLFDEYGFSPEYAKIIANIQFKNDYGNLSSKAIKKILPHLIDGEQYDVACVLAGYKTHSKESLTKEEIDNKELKDHLDNIPNKSLRNPVVEKILNQMINVTNSIIDEYGRPEEIRIEMSRDLKKNADERFMLTDSINQNTTEIENLKKEIKEKFPNIFGKYEPSRNDVIRYRLWQELAKNAHKPLYGSAENLKREITPAMLFTNDIEIEHILPKARLFDDSFSNKTLAFSSDNKEKSALTAFDYVGENGRAEYIDRIITVFGTKVTKKVVTNPTTKNKSIKTESKTFDSIYKEHERSMISSKKQKTSLAKWDSASDEERKKLSKPWARMNETEKKIEVINKYYSGKIKKLITRGSELPEGFINRDLANTQYITKKAKEMLGSIARYVVCTTGSITDRLREDWQLVDIMKELNWNKYKELGLTEEIEKEDYDGNKHIVKKIKDWTKRNDHRHHAMDALTTAFTKRSYIQYLNNLNARRTDIDQGISNAEKDDYDYTSITAEDVILPTRDVLAIEHKELYRDKNDKLRFKAPIPLEEFRAEAKRQLENILVSIKAKNKVVTKNVNVTKKKSGENKKVQLTPRGQLHGQTVYGQNDISRIELNDKISKEQIDSIVNPAIKEYIKECLKKYGSIKKAFGNENIPNIIYKGKQLTYLIVKIPCYTQRINVEKFFTDSQKTNSAKEKAIDSIIDLEIQKIIRDRYIRYEKDFKKAFSNLEENPIYLNESKGITIKHIKITGISNAEALHDKRDKECNLILNEEGKTQPVDFVSTGNNHHVAVFRKPKLDKNKQPILDEKGNVKYELDENIVSFYEATSRAVLGQPIIDKEYKKDEGWEFLFSMKQNEYFVFPRFDKDGNMIFNPLEHDENWYKNPENYAEISPNLYRVQKFTHGNYVFRHHLESTIDFSGYNLRGTTWNDFRSSKGLDMIVKVRVNHIGKIVSVGEY